MQLTPREFDKLLIYMMAEVALKRRPRASSSIPGSRRCHLRCRARRRACRQDNRRGDQGGAHRAHQGRRHGWRRRPDPDGADRGRVHRRQPPGDRAHADSVSPLRKEQSPWPVKVCPTVAANVDPATADVPVGGYVCSSDADHVPRGPAGDEAQGAQHRRPPGAGRLALPFLRSQSARSSSTAQPPSGCISTFRRRRRCASSPATSAR